jgi:hypothetical protein
VVGTGGASLYSFLTVQPNSEVRGNTSWGVLKLTLHPISYDWEFVPIAGQTFTDAGSGNCVGATVPTPTSTATPTPLPSDTATPVAPGDTATPTPTDTPLPASSDTPTPTDTPFPTDTSEPAPTLTSTTAADPTATHTSSPTALPAEEVIYLSSTSGGMAGGVSFADEDILAFRPASGTWSIFFDGSDVGLGGSDVDAFEVQPDRTILLSLTTDYSLAGFGTVDDSDLVRFTPSSLGTTTAGSFTWYFDGSDVGMTASGEDVDAVGFGPNGELLVSVTGPFSGTGASGADEDLFAFSGTTGAATSGTFRLYFDGSDVGLNTSSSEDVNGVWVEGSTGEIYLTTLGSFAVSGAAGDGSDIFVCRAKSMGATTACTFGPGLYWDGSAKGFGGEITDGIDHALGP